MDASLDTEQDNIAGGDHNSAQQGEHQIGTSEDADTNAHLNLSKKSWGFRRTTIARREFMDEIIDLDPSPPPIRRGRSRRTRQTPRPAEDPQPTPKPCRSASSVIDDLEWSAPSSPVDAAASEATTGGVLDPSLWQDFGSAFHTAFSLLGGNEDTPMDVTDPLPGPDDPHPTDASEAGAEVSETGADGSDSVEAAEDPSGPALMDVAGDENQEVLLISSQEDDSDNLTLMQLKEHLTSKGLARKGGRAKARGKGRGRGRGRGRGKGRGRGRGRAVELESSTAEDDEEEDRTLVNQEARPQLHEQQKPEGSPEVGVALDSPTKLNDSDCIVLDSDLDQPADVTQGQYENAVEEGRAEEERGYSSISDSEGYDPNALYCICRQKHNKRFMICCDGCQEWFHGDCVGIGEAQGRCMDRRGEEYTCPTCTSKKQRLPLPDNVQSEDLLESPEIPASLPDVLAPTASAETTMEVTKPQESKGDAEVMAEQSKPEPDIKTEKESSLPLCIGPGCPKQALQDSVYCGTDCILQHAAVTMKSLTGPKEPKPRSRPQRKAAAKGQRLGRVTQSAAERLKESEEEQEGDGAQKEAASPLACDPSFRAVEAAPVPSSKLCMACRYHSLHIHIQHLARSSSSTLNQYNQKQANTSSANKDSEELEAKEESVPPVPQKPTTATSSSIPVADTPLPQGSTQGKTQKPLTTGGVSKKQRLDSPQHTPTNLHKPSATPAPATPGPSSSRLPVMPAPKLAMGSFVIPKKQPAPPPAPSQGPDPVAGAQPSASPAATNETRTLPVAPAPIAPSSRPSQPNNQVRQSIQRSLASILFKRVTDCEELDMSESDVGKLVTSIEMEMFDIFRNTDSKYMNKYRTIMFNLKDPKNKGLLFRVIGGEISPFRLARMSQKDMQATKVPEPSAKETAEVVKDTVVKAPPCSLQKPDAVKVDLPSLSTPKTDKPMEQKRSVAPVVKSRLTQPSQIGSVPDILSCMLKDTTSEHKTHLFDLKCKICTGQMPEEEEEPAHKRSKVSDSRDKREYGRPSYGKPPENPWRSCAGDDSPLQAPPDSPDMDSPPNPLLEPSSRLVIDSPELAIVESPASLVLESPASPPVLESPASPVRDSPASPTADGFKTRPPARAYAPVVIPAVSTVTITRRDPRTAANRSPSLSAGAPGPGCTTKNQAAPYAALKVASSGPTMPPAVPLPPPLMPKSILMKPSPSADPRLYQTSSRNMNSHSTADGETTQFLANQTILWKGFLNMLSVAKFMTKGYVVSGSGEILKAELPDTIQIGGRILPQTVWDYVERVKTSELCVVRFHPATEEEEVAYVSLFSYFSSRRRFGVVANSSRNVKDMYLVPVSAKEAVPSILQPLEGAGLEKNRPNLLLGLAIVQKPKRPGCLQQESEEKRPKVQMSKDPMWIPKPPVLYGSDKPDIFQPYDPETPITGSPPSSPAASGTLAIPSLPIPSKSTISQFLPSNRGTLPVSTSAPVSSNQSILTANSDENPTATSANKTPLQTILKSLFGNKTSDTVAPAESSSVVPTVGATKPLYTSQTTRPMVDPIVQQYGQKSKIKAMEEEDHDFDRPYDPEEEYDPAMGYGVAQTIMKVPTDPPAPSTFAEDDVAYDPEDESMFEDVKKHNTIAKGHVPTATPCPTSASTEAPTPVSTTDTACATTAPVLQNLPTGIVVVSAATLTEQQRMLEELNKQIEEQKRQLKEQEEALRQQREAVGMFMAHFSVSDTLMSPPQKIVPATPLPSQQSGIAQSGQKTSESTEGKESLTKSINNQTLEIVKKEETSSIPESTNTSSAIIEQDEMVKDTEQYFSAGEIEDSDRMNPSLMKCKMIYSKERAQSLTMPYCPVQDMVHPEKGPLQVHIVVEDNGSHLRGVVGERETIVEVLQEVLNSVHHLIHEDGRIEKDTEEVKGNGQDMALGTSLNGRAAIAENGPRGAIQEDKENPRLPEKEILRHFHQNAKWELHLRSFRNHKSQVLRVILPWFLFQNHMRELNHPIPQLLLKCIMTNHHLNVTKLHLQLPIHRPTLKLLTLLPFLNVKLEKEECPLSLKPLKYATWHQQGITTTTRQLQNEFAFNSKIESPIPLRELEPPTRDSPQSPDPEPQFVQQSSIEKGDANLVIKKEEEMVDVSGEIGTGIQIERKGIGSKHCDILSKGFTGTNMGLEIKNAQPDVKVPPMHNIASLRGDMSKVEMTNFGNNFGIRAPAPIDQGILGVKQNIMGPETNTSGSMISGLWQLMGGPDMQGIGSDSWKTGPNMSDARMRVQGENPDIIISGNVMKDSSIRDLDPNVQGPGSPSVNPVRGVPAQAVTHPHTRGLDPLKVPDVGGRDLGTDIRGRGQGWSRFGDYSPNRSLAPHMTHSSPSVKDERPDFKSLHSVKRFIEERRRPDPVSDSMSQSQSRDGAESSVGPGVNNDRQGPQRALGPAIERPGLSFRDESSGNNMCGARQDNQGLRSNPSGLQLNVKQEMGRPYIGSDGGNPATQRPVGGPSPDMQNENRNQEVMRGPGPNTSGPGWEGGWGVHNPIGLDVRDAWKGSERRGSDLAFSGLNVQDEWRNNGPNKIEHMEIPRPDRRGPDMENQGSARDPAFRGPGPDQDQGTRPDLSGFGGQHFKGARSDYKGQLPEKTTSEMEGLGPDMSRSGCLDIREPGSNRRGPGVCPGPDEKGLGGPHFMGPENDRWPDFRGTRTDRGGTDMEGPGQDRRGMGRPHSRGSGPDRRASDMEGLGPERRGPGGTDFREVGADGREPYVEGPGPDRRRGGGPDFRGPRSARRGAHMDSPGPDRKGPGGSHFRGPGPDRREADVEGLGTGMRDRDNEPGRDGKGSDMEGPGLDRRGRVGPHFRGSGPDRRGQDLEGHGPDRTGPDREGPGPDRRGPRGPDFRRSRPYRSRPDLEGPGLGWRGMEGRRGRDKEGLSVDKSGPKVGGPDLTGMPLDGQGIVIENPGPDVTRIEGPKFSRPEPDRRGGRLGPDFRGHGLEKSVPRIECEPVMRGPGNLDCREQELEPDRKRPRRPDGRSLGHEMRGPDMECTEPEMEDYGPRMRASPGPNFRGPGPDRRGPGDPDSEGTDFRGPGPDTRLIADPEFMEPGSDGDYGLIGEGQMVLISGNQGLIGEGRVVQISGGQGLMGGGQLVQISVKQEGQEVLTSSDQVLIGEVQDQGLKREGQVVQISGDQDLIEKGLVDQISGNKGLIGEGQISQTPWVQILIGEVLVVQTSWDQGLMGEGQVVQISGDQHLIEEGQVVHTSENQGLIGEGQVGQISGDQGLIEEVHAGQTSGDPVLIGEGQMVQILGDQGLMGEGQVGQTGQTSGDQGLIGEGQVVQSSGDPVLK
ncbi:Death-inducer obliterator 1 [Merluccius polli]|uniref:Death-inducer obliterator 1 n=1 Tax=Merluccius polli TaxID=89951 RepID=A0AA47MWE9_MERPO|nr:Death-inducer obliterator 1 [Merluccius polli]